MAARRNIAQTRVEQSNVVRLPTAAGRRVKQPSPTQRRKAAKGLERLSVQFVAPHTREAVRSEGARRELLKDCRRTPELAIILAIVGTLSDESKAKVRAILKLANAMAQGDTSVAAALALIGGDA